MNKTIGNVFLLTLTAFDVIKFVECCLYIPDSYIQQPCDGFLVTPEIWTTLVFQLFVCPFLFISTDNCEYTLCECAYFCVYACVHAHMCVCVCVCVCVCLCMHACICHK
jgi:hypothetical protein